MIIRYRLEILKGILVPPSGGLKSKGHPVGATGTRLVVTLLHEMVHQWQCEQGLPLDHGQSFRRKALEVGIRPNATAPAGYLSHLDLYGTIA